MPRDGAIKFRDLIGKLSVLRIECEKCGRSCRSSKLQPCIHDDRAAALNCDPTQVGPDWRSDVRGFHMCDGGTSLKTSAPICCVLLQNTQSGCRCFRDDGLRLIEHVRSAADL
jgi:hypothetical protein